jgi:hypothetical protein
MTKEELYKYAMGEEHFRPQGFYWYHGEFLEGRIVQVIEELSPFDKDLSLPAYYFIHHNYYTPVSGSRYSYEIIKKHGRLIHHPDCIELTDAFNRHGNAELLDMPRDKQFKKLIIIGAGASYDFDSSKANVAEKTFPLTNNLFKFDHLGTQSSYPGVLALANDLAIENLQVEDYFLKEWKRISPRYNPKRLSELLNIQYYLHDLFFVLSAKNKNHIRNNYTSLSKALYDWGFEHENEKVGIINYNYDLLFDYTLEKRFGFEFTHLANYMNCEQRPFSLFKPHGSANWVKRFKREGRSIAILNEPNFQSNKATTSKIASKIFENKTTLAQILNETELNISIALEEERELLKPQLPNVLKPENYVQTNHPYLPQLLIPYKEKDEFVMPRTHTNMLKQVLPQVDEILIIGWKGEEKRMQEMLKEHAKQVKKVTLITAPWPDAKVESVEGVGKVSDKNSPPPKNSHEIRTLLEPILPNAQWVIERIGFTGFATKLANDEVEFFK